MLDDIIAELRAQTRGRAALPRRGESGTRPTALAEVRKKNIIIKKKLKNIKI